MKYSRVVLPVLLLLLFSLVVTADQHGGREVFDDESFNEDNNDDDDLYDKHFDKVAEEDIYEGIDDIEIVGDAGLTPDSNFYFLENLVENVLVGDNPETALEYKEEKILEVKAMIESGNHEAAEKALERAEKYNKILQKEVTPDLEERVRESSKATKRLLESFEDDVKGSDWREVKESIDQGLKKEDSIALAAKISKQIKELCETLSNVDPLQYSNVCKTDEDAPRWKRDLDERLTKEQAEEARHFFGIMSECFQNPAECRCNDISIKPFAEQCSIFAPLVAACDAGDEAACEKMEDMDDPIDLLPDYLQDVLDEIGDQYGEARHDLHIPTECVTEGALTRASCMEVMFRIHAPPECQEALQRGEIDVTNERDARKACEKVMFDLEAPRECKEAGLGDHRECEKLMFKLDAPQECLDAGLTGLGRDDWKKCDVIRFKLDAPQECLDAGIDGTGRDDWKKCEAINFRLDSPQECLDAGLDGTGRDDWRTCDIIRFKLEAAPECLEAGLTGEGRNDWRECGAIQFKLDAHPDCIAAGLDGTGRRDWDECNAIQFRADAPQECLDAGLDGTGRRDWDECNKITEKLDDYNHEDDKDYGTAREDCHNDEVHYCDDSGYCTCLTQDEYDTKQGYDNYDEQRHEGDENGNEDDYKREDYDGNGFDCAAALCNEGTYCVDGVGCVPDDGNSPDDGYDNDDGYDDEYDRDDQDNNFDDDFDDGSSDNHDGFDNDEREASGDDSSGTPGDGSTDSGQKSDNPDSTAGEPTDGDVPSDADDPGPDPESTGVSE